MSEKKYIVEECPEHVTLHPNVTLLTIPEAFAKWCRLVKEEGYGMRTGFGRKGELIWDDVVNRWVLVHVSQTSDRYLVLTPPSPEPVNIWMAWCDKMPIKDNYATFEIYERAMVLWYKSMPGL